MANAPAQEIHVPGLEILEEIGKGAFSTVYLARRGEEKVALKLCNLADTDSAQMMKQQFFREGASMARFNHPGLPKIMEVGDWEKQPFLVMEYVKGKTLADLLKNGPIPESQAVSIAKTFAGALAEVHRHGLVHRDIKPQNIMISDSGAAKLIDFGFVAEKTDAENPENSGVAGTFLYSAPEQTGMLKRPIDGRADLYALGVVLFECLTGKLPFNSDDAGELIRRHAVEPPPDICKLNPSVSIGAARITARLLAKDPDDRYLNGESLLRALENPDQPYSMELGEILEHELPLIGRETELAQIKKGWDSAARNKGSFLIVEGQPGSGKSRLTAELLGAAYKDSALVLTGKYSENDPIPLSPIRKAIDNHLNKIRSLPPEDRQKAEDRIRSACGEAAPLLKKFSPGLTLLLEKVPELTVQDDLQDQFYNAVAAFLLNLAEIHSKALFIIDDAQWMDEASFQVFRRLADEIGKSPLLIACTFRNDPDSMIGLNRFTKGMGQAVGIRIKLSLLGSQAIGQLVAAHLGSNRSIDPQFIRYLENISNGSPFAIGEYLRAMLDAGLLRPSWGSWLVDMKGMESLRLPNDVVQLVLKRLESLSEKHKGILTAGALLGSRFELALLPQITGFKISEINSAINQAVAANLVRRESAGVYGFAHDRVREALLSVLTQNDRMVLHQRIAEAMDANHPADENSDFVYALAQHYALGDAVRNPQKVYETNLAAGIVAIKNFADEQAYAFLKRSLEYLEVARLKFDPQLGEALGQVCLRTGRLDECIPLLEKSLEFCTDNLNRSKLRTHLAKAQYSRFSNDSAFDEIVEAVSETGYSLPRRKIAQVFSLLSYLVRGLGVLYFGKGKVNHKEQDALRVMIPPVGQGMVIAVLRGDIISALELTCRMFYAIQKLDLCFEKADGLSFVAGVFGAMGLKKACHYFIRKSSEAAAQLGDLVIQARANMRHGQGYLYLGDSLHAEQCFKQGLDKQGRWLDYRDFLMGSVEYIFVYSSRGFSNQAVNWAENVRKRAALEGEANRQPEFHLSLILAPLARLGRAGEASDYLRILNELIKKFPTKINQAGFYSNLMLFHVEQGELGEPLEDTIRKFRSMKLTPSTLQYSFRVFYVGEAYARLAQLQKAKDEKERQTRRRQLEAALKDLKAAASSTIYLSYYFIVRATLEKMDGHPDKALELLSKTEEYACEQNAPLLLFEVYQLRAEIYQEKGYEASALRIAESAYQLAIEYGWIFHARRIQERFKLDDKTAHASRGYRSSNASSMSSDYTNPAMIKFQRHRDALLQLSLASAKVFDPTQQARAALDQIIRNLGAERAFLFLCKERSEELVANLGRDAHGNDIAELNGYSRTLVEKVRVTRQALVISGTDEGAALGAQSVMVYNLRSILVAPLLMQDHLVGVVYLDNRIAKGLFTADDVEILQAMANHIAIALETARAARLEVERTSMEKDLALTSAVQALLLPKHSQFGSSGIRAASFYLPTTHCGGDWWCYETKADGRIAVFMGDVTGHGPGAAMVTAAMAGSYNALKDVAEFETIPKLLEALNTHLVNLCDQQYWMTFSAVEVDAKQGKLAYWSAGAPPIFVMKASGAINVISARGAPFGAGALSLGEERCSLEKGDRVILFTDGLSELKAPGSTRLLGLRKLSKLLMETNGKNAEQACEHVLQKVKDIRAGTPADDDISMVVLDVTGE